MVKLTNHKDNVIMLGLLLALSLSFGYNVSSLSLCLSIFVLSVTSVFVLLNKHKERSADESSKIRAFPCMIFMFVCVAALSVLSSVYPLDSYVTWVNYAGFLLAFLIACHTGAVSRPILIAVIVASAFFMGVWDLATSQMFTRDLSALSGFFLSPNIYAGYLNVSIFLCFIQFLTAEGKKLKSVWLTVFALLVLFLFMTGSKGAIISCLLSFLFIAWFLRDTFLQQKNWCGIALMTVLLLVGSFGLSQPSTSPVLAILDFKEVENGQSSRMQMWQDAASIAMERPFTGYGLGMFRYPYAAIRSELRTAGFHVHMDSLQFWVEMGIAGLALFYLMGAWFLRLYFCFVRDKSIRTEDKLFISGLFGAALSIVFHSHISMHLHNLTILLLMGALVGWFYSVVKVHDKTIYTVSMKRVSARLKGGISILLLCVVLHAGSLNYMEDRAFEKAAKAEGIEDVLKHLNFYNVVSLGMDEDPYVLAASLYISMAENQDHDIALQDSYYSQAEALLAQASKNETGNLQVLYTKGIMLLGQQNVPAAFRFEEAVMLFTQALSKDRLYLPVRVALADLYLKQNKVDMAKDLLYAAANINHQTFSTEQYKKMSCDISVNDDSGRAQYVRSVLRCDDK